MMDTTCEFCGHWTAVTWKQHRIRMRNIQLAPEIKPHPCPRCGGIYWAIKPPSSFSDEEKEIHWMIRWAMILGGGLVIGFALTMYASAQQTTFRDSSGRVTGYASPDSNGTTTFRDSSGRMTGTATTDRNGRTTFRDASGRLTGTTDRRR